MPNIRVLRTIQWGTIFGKIYFTVKSRMQKEIDQIVCAIAVIQWGNVFWQTCNTVYQWRQCSNTVKCKWTALLLGIQWGNILLKYISLYVFSEITKSTVIYMCCRFYSKIIPFDKICFTVYSFDDDNSVKECNQYSNTRISCYTVV